MNWRQRLNMSRAGRGGAARRVCPSCKRGAALVSQVVQDAGGTIVVRQCRYCPFSDRRTVSRAP